jgi:peptidoglycan/LPS O-acetylase OafA/YrhL
MQLMNSSVGHRKDLDGLRGVAILLVFAVHSMPHDLPGGFVGVDVFFVLSGYLIALHTFQAVDQRRFSWSDFYASRLRRLGPALAVVLLAGVLACVALLLPKDAKLLGQHLAAGAGFVSNLVLWREGGYFDESSELKPMLHLWSLGVEGQFYLVWPIFVLLFLRWPRWRLAVVLVALIASFALNASFVAVKPKGTFYLPVTRFWELLVGVLVACLAGQTEPTPQALWRRWSVRWQERWQSRRVEWASAVSGLGLALLLSALLLIDKTARFPGWWALMPTIGTALVIVAGPRAWLNRTLLSHPVLQFYGLISYALYLWHWPLLVIPRLMGWSLDWLGHATVLMLGVGLATATTWWVERPARTGRFKPWAVHASGVALTLVIAMGMMIWHEDGLPGRYPLELQEVARVHVQTDYEAYRVERCFLRSEQGPEAFAAECSPPASANARVWVLWGDSHAASLWPGLHLQMPARGVDLAQWTAAACPPGWRSAEGRSPACAAVNADVLLRIRRLRPEAVVLAADWIDARAESSGPARRRAQVLADTVSELRAAGVRRVIVVGPLPRWRVEAPRIVIGAWRRDGRWSTTEADAVDDAATEQDVEVKAEAVAAGAEYLSPMDALCDKAVCKILVPGPGAAQVFAFDTAHLTAAGSRWLVQALGLSDPSFVAR